MHIEVWETLFLLVWIVIGSTLGYFAFIYTHEWPIYKKICRCLLSVILGLFLAIPLFHYLLDLEDITKHEAILFSGLGALGLPDIMLKFWPKIRDAIGNFFVRKIDTKD